MLIHTPRTIHAIGKGLARRRTNLGQAHIGGIGTNNPYVSYNRVGIFDCDYLMHMNNAAYLSHAEYARWELCAYNGLMESMYKDNVHFVVGGTMVRFRREIRPVFRAFQVHTVLARVDERCLWMFHTFRYAPGGKDPGRIRAQVLCQGMAIQDRKVIDPRVYLKESVGLDAEIVDSISAEGGSGDTTMEELMDKYGELEDYFRKTAAEDDEALSKKE